MEEIRVKNGRLVRAVTFLNTGQRYESWLPPAKWQVQGECMLSVGRDSSAMMPAVILYNLTPVLFCHAGKWYVSPDSLEAMRRAVA